MSSNISFFDNPDEIPLPPDDVRITEVRVDPLPDGRRVVVSVKLTPFVEKPDLDVTLLRGGVEERSLSLVGAMQPQLQLTMHLPEGDPSGSYTARIDLLHDGEIRQSETAAFEVSRPAP